MREKIVCILGVLEAKPVDNEVGVRNLSAHLESAEKTTYSTLKCSHLFEVGNLQFLLHNLRR